MKKLISSLILILAILMCACGSSSENQEGAYTLYYTNETSSTMVAYSYTPSSKDTVALVKEFYDQMLNVTEKNSVSVIPKEMNLEDVKLADGIVDLHIGGDVTELTKAGRLIYFAALTKSITSIEGVSGIRLLYKGEIVTDETGTETGIMRSDTFINNVSDNADDYAQAEVNLYFADEDKDSLVKTTQTVTYRSTTSLERVVLEKLIEGPEDSNSNPTLSSNLSILGISTRDGVCYVNLNDAFVSDPVTSFDQVPVYSIVNSLTELPGINSVQISVNGSKDVKMPMGKISLSSPFTFNKEIVTR